MATADKLALLKATKADLKAALTEQGQTPGDVFETYPDLVRAIETGVTLPTLTSPGAAADLRQGKQLIDQSGAVVNGAIPDKAGQSYVPTTTSQKIAAGQYLAGDQIIAGDANLLPENIVSGKSIFGVAGTAESSVITETLYSNYDTTVFNRVTLANSSNGFVGYYTIKIKTQRAIKTLRGLGLSLIRASSNEKMYVSFSTILNNFISGVSEFLQIDGCSHYSNTTKDESLGTQIYVGGIPGTTSEEWITVSGNEITINVNLATLYNYEINHGYSIDWPMDSSSRYWLVSGSIIYEPAD